MGAIGFLDPVLRRNWTSGPIRLYVFSPTYEVEALGDAEAL